MSPIGRAMPDLSVRTRRAELMDDPDLDRGRHMKALRALSTINRVSLVGARLWREVDGLRARARGPVRVLDLGCGGGDVLLDVARRARRAGAAVELHGFDRSPVAIARARAAAGAVEGVAQGRDRQPVAAGARAGQGHGYPSRGRGYEPDPPEGGSVRFHELDVLRSELPEDYDLVTCSLFLHHLDRPEAIDLLRRMGQAARHRVFVQDLRRTRLGYLLAWIGIHTLARSDVVRVDGLRSVEAAFTMPEARALCVEAGLQGAEVARSWPQRYAIRWTRAGPG